MNPISIKLLFSFLFYRQKYFYRCIRQGFCRKCRCCEKITPIFIGGCCQNFCKGPKLLYHINHPNVISLLEVCENPMALMMDFSGFLFASFSNDLISHFLDVFLKPLDKNKFRIAFSQLIQYRS